MLTIFEEIQLRRLREFTEACLVAIFAAGGVALICAVIALCGGPREFYCVAAFEGLVALIAWAVRRPARRRQLELEEFL